MLHGLFGADWEEGDKKKCEPYLPIEKFYTTSPSQIVIQKLDPITTNYFEITPCRLLWKDDFLLLNHIRFLGWPDRGLFRRSSYFLLRNEYLMHLNSYRHVCRCSDIVEAGCGVH